MDDRTVYVPWKTWPPVLCSYIYVQTHTHTLHPGLGDITNTHPSIEQPTFASLSHLVTEPSEDTTILSVLAGQPDGSVNYIALGPLTNLALALKADEALFKRKVKRVTIMGGALDVPGNTSPTAEFNIYAVSGGRRDWR